MVSLLLLASAGSVIRFIAVASYDRSVYFAGLPVTSVRELRVLQSCEHKNLVQLKRVVTGTKLDRCLSDN